MNDRIITASIANEFLAGRIDLDEYDAMDDDAAEILAQADGGLRLDGLKSISVESAKSLAKHNGKYLLLGGVTSISDEVAEALAEHRGGIAIDGVMSISVEAARALARHVSPDGKGDPESRYAIFGAMARAEGINSGFVMFNVDLEDHMVNYSPGFLLLGGITDLSDEAAEAIAQHEGWIDLHGLEELSARAAKAFAARPGPTSIGVATLSDAVAEELAKARGLLNLDAVADLSPAARALLEENGNISMSTAEAIDDSDDATSEEDPPSSTFPFEDVETLTPEVAEAAAGFDGNITFSELTDLTEAEAAILARHRGRLGFLSLTAIEPGVARALMNHEGHIYIPFLQTIDTDTARLLLQTSRDFPYIALYNIRHLGIEEAVILARFQGDIYLNDLQSLTEDVASALSGLSGKLYLGEAVEIDVHIARRLAKIGSGLVLNSPNLSDEVIHELAQSCSVLGLDGLASLSPAAATSLSNHVGQLSLNGLMNATDEVAMLLSKHEGPLDLMNFSDMDKLSDAAKEAMLCNPDIKIGSARSGKSDADDDDDDDEAFLKFFLG
ncbi:MAG: hypothetical protein FGM32_09015 [Candidatus Kapabacteria bacterium]|nr:hypothetical protein [Candidatus Kapabacteria bacterium]